MSIFKFKCGFSMIFLLLFGSTGLMAENRWEPDYSLAKQLIKLPIDRIQDEFAIKIKEEKVKYALLISRKLIYSFKEYEKAKVYLKLAENELEKKKGEYKAWVSIYTFYMSIAQYNYDYRKAIDYGILGLQHAKKDKKYNVDMLFYLLKSISDSYYTVGDYVNSVKYSKEMADEAENVGSVINEAEAQYSLASAYYRSSKLSEAEKSAHKAFELYKKIDNTKGLGHSKKVLGSVYNARGLHEKAKESYLEAIRYYSKIKNHHGVANCNYNLGVMFKKSKSYAESIIYLENASYHFMQSGSASGSGMSKMEQGNVYQKLGEFEKASLLYEESKNLLTRTNALNRLAQLETYYASYYLKLNRKDAAKQSYINAMKIYRNSNNQVMVDWVSKQINKI